MDAIQKKIADSYLEKIADRVYEEAVRNWESKIEMEEAQNVERFKDPSFSGSLGLPQSLPDHTIQILKKTLALDKIGPQKPERDKIYRRYGLD